MSSIYENNNYKVEIGQSKVIEGMRVYVVINKRTSIVEAEDMMLPKVIDYANQLDDAVIEMVVEGTLDGFVVPGEETSLEPTIQ